ncbi:hypothetical protein ScPMuIL_001530 [Solemya velum]
MCRVFFVQQTECVPATNIKFIVLGDWGGRVENVNDKRFRDTFEDVFDSPYFNIPWYMLAGNHDHRGNVSAQIAYSQISSKWTFPHYYYKQTKRIVGSNVTLDILMLDTVILCGQADDEMVQQPTGVSNQTFAEQQWAWLTNELATSRATYLLVAGHFPIYSIGVHGANHLSYAKTHAAATHI